MEPDKAIAAVREHVQAAASSAGQDVSFEEHEDGATIVHSGDEAVARIGELGGKLHVSMGAEAEGGALLPLIGDDITDTTVEQAASTITRAVTRHHEA